VPTGSTEPNLPISWQDSAASESNLGCSTVKQYIWRPGNVRDFGDSLTDEGGELAKQIEVTPEVETR
jgi:hypothetical protein